MTKTGVVFGMNTIEPMLSLINYAKSVGIIVMFLIFAISPYRS